MYTARMSATIDAKAAEALVDKVFEDSIVPTLVEYIKIPNKSPDFDPDWEKNGHMQKAMDLIVGWCKDHPLKDMKLEVLQLPGRTPLLFIDVPGEIDDTVLIYGHMDKQPEMTGWDDDLGPWKPVIKGDRLYGRGGADDGYSTFASLTALSILQEQGIPHARCAVLIEGCDGNYDQMWCTTSLRGMVVGNLHVEVIAEGVHSGDASGIVPSSFRILRMLLSRLEDENTGNIIPKELYCEIPDQRREQAAKVADALGNRVWDHFPFHEGAGPIDSDNTELVLNRTWKPQLAITGAAGLTDVGSAGNVMRPITSARVSIRLPPEVKGEKAKDFVTELLTKDPPYGAKVRFESEEGNDGWNAPPVAEWLEKALNDASKTYFGAPSMYMGEGGTIPFMGMLGDKFPKAQFMITGVLGPESNAHGPNEFLHIPTAKKLSCCVAETIRQHGLRTK
jgi:acetylornithine deacetylase/succinyl-diaminopimelate desuccinylase-like protein